MWDNAYNNTKSISFVNQYNIRCFFKICKKCNTITINKPTREMHIVGNCIQRITKCYCGLTFIEDLN